MTAGRERVKQVATEARAAMVANRQTVPGKVVSSRQLAPLPVSKQLGEPGMSHAQIAQVSEIAMVQDGMVGEPFSPGAPMTPFSGNYGGRPRTRDYQTGYNIATRPRIGEQVSFSTLRGVVDAYDVAQMCIWHRIDSVRSLTWSITAKKGETGDQTAAIQFAETVFRKPDGEFSFKNFLAKYLYDVLAFDAGALYRRRNNAGNAIGLRVLDGTTIAPLLDYYGNRPSGDAPAYVQFAQGLPWEWLADDDLVYEPFRPQSNSLYGKAPMESILLNANTDLRFQQYFLNRFTEGNVPEGFAGAPEGWTADQVAEYQETWDALLYGDDSQKHQLKWVPHGTTFDWSNETQFSDEFSLFLMRKTAAAFHVTPADLGFTEDVNRSSGDTQADVQFRIGDRPLVEHCQEIFTRFLQDDLYLPLDFQFSTGREVEDRVATAEANQIYVNMGAISVSEVRETEFGLSEPEGKPVPRFIMSTRSGPIPLSALDAVAGPVDMDTAAPALGAPLPHHPFAPVEGVTPQQPPKQPALAVVEYPQDNTETLALPAGSSAPTIPPAPAPVQPEQEEEVAKAGGDCGCCAGTGEHANGGECYICGGSGDSEGERSICENNPLSRYFEKHMREDYGLNPDGTRIAKDTGLGVTVVGATVAPSYDDLDEEAQVAKAAEERTFRRFVATRQRQGKWRDFDFSTVDARTAQERNRAARAQVRKEAGEISVAGLAVRAADTGRVLLLQRGLDPEDPAQGKWEFPGGHLEDGEDPLTAAVREWCEETGCLPPLNGTIISQWTSANFVYQGIVLEIPSESDVDLAGGRRVNNPDDPDGDIVEAVAWWDPADMVDNPVVRQELAEDLNLVLTALAGDVVEEVVAEEVAKAASAWANHAFRKIDEPLVDHHGPQVAEAMRQMVSKEAIVQAVAAYLERSKP